MGADLWKMSLVGGDYDNSDDDDEASPERVPDVQSAPDVIHPENPVQRGSALPSVAQLFGDPSLSVASAAPTLGCSDKPSASVKPSAPETDAKAAIKPTQRLLPPQVRSSRKNFVTEDVSSWNTKHTRKRQKKMDVVSVTKAQ